MAQLESDSSDNEEKGENSLDQPALDDCTEPQPSGPAPSPSPTPSELPRHTSQSSISILPPIDGRASLISRVSIDIEHVRISDAHRYSMSGLITPPVHSSPTPSMSAEDLSLLMSETYVTLYTLLLVYCMGEWTPSLPAAPAPLLPPPVSRVEERDEKKEVLEFKEGFIDEQEEEEEKEKEEKKEEVGIVEVEDADPPAPFVTADDSHVYLNGLLLMVNRVTKKMTLLRLIEKLVSDPDTNRDVRKGLIRLIETWNRDYPDDFNSAEAKRMAGVIFKHKDMDSIDSFPTFVRLKKAKSVTLSKTSAAGSSVDSIASVEEIPAAVYSKKKKKKKKSKSRASLSRHSITSLTIFRSKSVSTVITEEEWNMGDHPLRSGVLYLEMPDEIWMEIKTRKLVDKLAKCYLSDEDYRKVISRLGGSTKKRTIEWRAEFPLWYLRQAAAPIARRRGDTITEPEKGQIWDETWPWLTLYFIEKFPSKFGSTELNPRHVAESITLNKFEVFIRIKHREFSNLGWRSRDRRRRSPFITRMIDLFNAECKWAVMVFLNESSLRGRALKVKALCSIVTHLIDLGNFDSACAIRLGLIKISGKKMPMGDLSTTTKKMRKTVFDFDDSTHSNPYNLTLERLKEGKSVIPVMATTLDKLYRIEQRVIQKRKHSVADLSKSMAAQPNFDHLINLRWLKDMYDTCSVIFDAQDLSMDEVSRFHSHHILPTDPYYYWGISVDRRDIRLLLIKELKMWGSQDDKYVDNMINLNVKADVDIPRLQRMWSSGGRR